MGSYLTFACALIMGICAGAFLFVLPAWLVEQSVNGIAANLNKLTAELSKKLDQLHKRPEEYYE